MSLKRLIHCLTLVLLLLGACGAPVAAPPTITPGPVVRAIPRPVDPGRLAAPQTPAPETAPLLETRRALLDAALTGDPPILLLADLDATQQTAQMLAVQDSRVRQAVVSAENRPMRAEVFGVYPVGAADLPPGSPACPACYRVEIYNFALNATILALVEPQSGDVRTVEVLRDTQPTIVPRHLMDLAAQIALASPEVRAELGLQPDARMIQQPQMKVQFQSTACERSRHLCVAPIFVWGERALWVIVDLVDTTIIGLRWTELGESSRRPISEQRLQDEVVTAQYCDRQTELQRDGWSLRYGLTGSDGLRIEDVRFAGKPVLRSAKLVDVHINYSRQEGFGYSDALGCPAFSAAAVVAWNGPQIEPITTPDGVAGFALVQRFRSEFWPTPCNYAYRQRYEFYADGRFRIVFVSEGRGCSNNAVYRPVLRIAPAGEQLGIAAWDGAAWQPWAQEGWQLQRPTTAYTPEGYQYRIDNRAGGSWYLLPGQGQFGDGGRGDNAYLYATRVITGRDEGEGELPTLGDCCNSDERQGPERFLDPAEPLGDAPLVLWYVPQLENDDTPGSQYCWADAALRDGVFVPQIWPCAAGPMFVPIGAPRP